MGKPYGPQPSPSVTPDTVGSAGTPPASIGADHSFTLQAIMELQKSTGTLTASVESLQKSIEKLDAKIDRVESTVSGITHKVYAATVVLIILVAIGGFVVDKAWDLMAASISQQPQVTTPSPQEQNKLPRNTY